MNTIIPIILIAISGAMFFMYIDPLYVGDKEGGKIGIKQLLKDRQKIDFQTDKIREIQQRKKELEKDYKSLSASNEYALDDLSKMIPDNMENARLINYIHTIKQGSFVSGMSDIRLTTDTQNGKKDNGQIAIKEQKHYKSVNLSFSFTSDYKNFIKFMGDLYKSLRIVDVVSVSFKPDGSDAEAAQDKFSFNIVIRTY